MGLIIDKTDELKDTETAFFKATSRSSEIYVKVKGIIINNIVETLVENGYTISKIEAKTWDYNIETGDSYEIDTKEEVEEFIANNLKFRTHA